MLYHHGLTGCGSLRASCGFCACPAVRGQCVRCILRLLISGPFCRLCGSLAAVDRGQGVCPSWCRSGSQRLPWCVSCAPGFGPLLLSVRRVSAAHGAWSDAVLCRQLCGTVGKVWLLLVRIIGGASSSLGPLFYRYSWGFYLSSIGLLSLYMPYPYRYYIYYIYYIMSDDIRRDLRDDIIL